MTTTTRWLLPFTGEPEGRCPKCLTKPVMTEYHDTVVIGMCKERRDTVVLLSDHDVPEECTEHLCRGCPSCGYLWSEFVAGPEDLDRAKASLSSYVD
jgi:hypothetical protein